MTAINTNTTRRAILAGAAIFAAAAPVAAVAAPAPVAIGDTLTSLPSGPPQRRATSCRLP